MNYLEIVNQCLFELNYKKVNDFAELTKNEHKRILTSINVVNKEVCNVEDWDFLLRKTELTINPNTQEISNTINGKILHLFIDKEEYFYTNNVKKFFENTNFTDKKYTLLGDKLLFPKFSEEKNLEIIFYTNNCATDENNQEKENLENKNDKSLIPMPFAEQLLVYGACLRVKANPQHYKFSYWMSMYKEALLNLKSKTLISVQSSPQISLFRK